MADLYRSGWQIKVIWGASHLRYALDERPGPANEASK